MFTFFNFFCREDSYFRIQDAFTISLDTELLNCPPFLKSFWNVVEEFSNGHKRKFIEFVTGVKQLPLPKTEVGYDT